MLTPSKQSPQSHFRSNHFLKRIIWNSASASQDFTWIKVMPLNLPAFNAVLSLERKEATSWKKKKKKKNSEQGERETTVI